MSCSGKRPTGWKDISGRTSRPARLHSGTRSREFFSRTFVMAKKAVIVGWSHIPFGQRIEPETEPLMARVSGGALEQSGITGNDVDRKSVGSGKSVYVRGDMGGRRYVTKKNS